MKQKILSLFMAFVIPYCCYSHGKHHHDHHHNHDHDHDGHEKTIHNAILGTTIITLGGNAALFVFSSLDIGKKGLNMLLAFAMGSLLGDAFLHLIPHARDESTQDHHDHHHSNNVEIDVLYGILTFLLVEKLLHMIEVGGEDKGIKTGAVLNLIGDVIHNFTDGMAISSAFLISESVGRSVTIAVLLHEIPHELGDFAVLVSHGFSKRGAFMSQFISAIGAFLGTAIGLFLGTSSDFPTGRVLGFTAGGFIYISLVEISPKLLEHGNTWLQSSMELGAVICGIGFMKSMIEFEEAIGV